MDLPEGWYEIPVDAEHSAGPKQLTGTTSTATAPSGYSMAAQYHISGGGEASSSSAMQRVQPEPSWPEGPVRVEEYKGRYRFNRSDGKRVETAMEEWVKSTAWLDEEWKDVWFYTGKSTGKQYYTFQPLK